MGLRKRMSPSWKLKNRKSQLALREGKRTAKKKTGNCNSILNNTTEWQTKPKKQNNYEPFSIISADILEHLTSHLTSATHLSSCSSMNLVKVTSTLLPSGPLTLVTQVRSGLYRSGLPALVTDIGPPSSVRWRVRLQPASETSATDKEQQKITFSPASTHSQKNDAL